MFKLIESNGNGIKEVLSNGKVIWRKELEVIKFSSIYLRTGQEEYIGSYGAIRNLPVDFIKKYQNNSLLFTKEFKAIKTNRETLELNRMSFFGKPNSRELRSYSPAFIDFVKRNRYESSIDLVKRTGGVILNSSIQGKRDVTNYVDMNRKAEFVEVVTYQASTKLSRGNYHLYIQSSEDMQVNITFEKIDEWGVTDIVYKQNRVRTNQEIEIDVNAPHSFTQISVHTKKISAIQQVILSSDRIIE